MLVELELDPSVLYCQSSFFLLLPAHIIYPIKQSSKQEIERKGRGFPGGAVVENLPANAGDTGSSPGLGGSHMPRSS